MMDTGRSSVAADGRPATAELRSAAGGARVPDPAWTGATGAGSHRFAQRFAAGFVADFYRPGPGDLRLSSLGIGTYLGESDDADDARYERAVGIAIASGVNVLDTAINYRCQRSERTVGRAVAAAIASGVASRDELVVCTKGGYIPLDGSVPTREEYQAMVQRDYLEAGLMQRDEVVAGGHSIAPSFLADQIARSRANLGGLAIDIYYLHNPEQQIAATGEMVFRARLIRAFELLEGRVEAGDIGCYGCATWNGLRAAPGSRDHLSLATLLEVAHAVAGDGHHFRAVQLPVSLAMSEAVRTPTQRVRGRDVTLLEAAMDLDVTVVASAPLMQAALARGLPPAVRDALPTLGTDAQRALAFVRDLPGLASALVGMRDPAHVEENLGIATAGGRR